MKTLSIVALISVFFTPRLLATPQGHPAPPDAIFEPFASIDPDDREESHALQACVPAGIQLLRCGCNGYVEFGVAYPAAFCCSGYARAFPCGGSCYGGGSPWYNVCTY